MPAHQVGSSLDRLRQILQPYLQPTELSDDEKVEKMWMEVKPIFLKFGIQAPCHIQHLCMNVNRCFPDLSNWEATMESFMERYGETYTGMTTCKYYHQNSGRAHEWMFFYPQTHRIGFVRQTKILGPCFKVLLSTVS